MRISPENCAVCPLVEAYKEKHTTLLQCRIDRQVSQIVYHDDDESIRPHNCPLRKEQVKTTNL